MQTKSVLIVALLLSFSAFADELELTFETEEIATPPEVIRQIERAMERRPVDTLIHALDPITDIINIGLSFWKIVEAGKPVLQAKHAYANALPAGIKSAGELENFSPIQFRSYVRRATSWYYGTAFEITYTLAHKYNGSHDGKGRFLDAVTILPHKVDVSWAYGLDVTVDKISVSNLSSKGDPIACVVMEFAMKVTSWFKSSQYRNIYEFRGDSSTVRAIE